MLTTIGMFMVVALLVWLWAVEHARSQRHAGEQRALQLVPIRSHDQRKDLQ